MPRQVSHYNKYRKRRLEQPLVDANLVYLSGYESGINENRGGSATVSNGGGVFQSAVQQKFGSNSLDIVTGELSFNTGDMPLAGDFTLEGWIYPTTLSSSVFRAIAGNFNTVNNGWILWVTLSTDPRLQINFGGGSFFNSTTVIQLNQWQHFAVSRFGNTVRVWVDGNYEGSYSYSSSPDDTNAVKIGNNANLNVRWDGYLDELRFVDGYCIKKYRNNADVSVPTGPY